MTRDDHRAKCIEAMAKARWRLDCMESEEDYRREGRTIPERWADPWDESGTGLHQRRKYIREATFAFDSLHGVALVVPIEATEEMIEEGAKAVAEYQAHLSWDIIGDDLKNAHRRRVRAILGAMSAVGDITNTPETKP